MSIDSLVLYRGLHLEPEAFKGVSSPTERRDKHMHMQNQNFLDSYMLGKKAVAVRSNSIYCTGDILQAQDYGKVYRIIPLEGFHFSYFVGVQDLFVSLQRFLKRTSWIQNYQHLTTQEAEIFRDIGIDEEILGEYLRHEKEGVLVKRVLKRDWLSKLELRTDNLEHAIETKSEILISGFYDIHQIHAE
jgi:hypothetical protein